jgi:hypothetical protein
MHLGNIALGLAYANLTQGSELVVAQQSRLSADHLAIFQF